VSISDLVFLLVHFVHFFVHNLFLFNSILLFVNFPLVPYNLVQILFSLHFTLSSICFILFKKKKKEKERDFLFYFCLCSWPCKFQIIDRSNKISIDPLSIDRPLNSIDRPQLRRQLLDKISSRKFFTKKNSFWSQLVSILIYFIYFCCYSCVNCMHLC
jgi:hypothetical protein